MSIAFQYLIAPEVAFLACVIIGVIILVQNKKDKTHFFFFLLDLILLLGVATDIIVRQGVLDNYNISIVLKAQAFAWIFTGVIYYAFVFALIKSKKGYPFYLLQLFVFSAFIYFTMNVSFIRLFDNNSWLYVINPKSLYYVLVPVIVVPMLYGDWLLIKAYRNTNDRIEKKIILNMVLGNIISLLFSLHYVFFQLSYRFIAMYISPWIIVGLIQMLFVSWAILKYRFLFIEIESMAELLFNTTSEGVIVIDKKLRIFDINPAAKSILNLRHKNYGKPIYNILPGMRDFGNQKRFTLDIYIRGEDRYLSITRKPLVFLKEQTFEVLMIIDQTFGKVHQKESLKYEFIVNASTESMMLINKKCIVEAVNDSYLKATGFKKENCIDKELQALWLPLFYSETLLPKINEAFNSRASKIDCEYTFTAWGHRILEISFFPYYSGYEKGRPLVTHVAIVIHDATIRKKAEDRLRYNAYHDPLTRLSNRALLFDRLKLTINHSLRHVEMKFAILFLDLDKFKIINDSLGHLTGDELLISFSKRLQKLMRSSDTLARLGGDEFIVLLNPIDNERDATMVADRILESLEQPFDLNGQSIMITTSIGIAIGSNSYRDASEYLRDADTALYRAKAKGRNRWVIFDREMHEAVKKTLKLESDLQKAVKDHELMCYFQPIVDFAGKRIAGFEALIRWNHPEKGVLPPSEFIGTAEENQVINKIGQFVLENACVQLVQWQKKNFFKMYITVNVSPRQFLVADFADKLLATISKYNIDSSLIKLEITENTAMIDVKLSIATMNKLHNAGIEIFIDDFGTGFSSLSYLVQFPVAAIKMDKSLVQNISKKGMGKNLALSIIDMGHRLNLKVVAEGVETLEQLNSLDEHGCDLYQGYYFSKPLSAFQLEELLNDGVENPFEKIYK